MKKAFVISLIFALACFTPHSIPSVVQVVPEAILAEPDTMVEALGVKVIAYQYASDVFYGLDSLSNGFNTEVAACITRWNSSWKGDTLKTIQIFAAVPLVPVAVSDSSFTPPHSIGNCWWQLPSIHWHRYDAEPSELDYASAVRSAAPFQLLVFRGRFYLYALRPAALKRNNTR